VKCKCSKLSPNFYRVGTFPEEKEGKNRMGKSVNRIDLDFASDEASCDGQLNGLVAQSCV